MAKAAENQYKFVDVYYCDENGKNSPWKRIDIANLPTFQREEAKDFNCFATVQQYSNDSKVEGEDFIAPLYFDLDYEQDPTVAQKEAIKIIDFFTKELDVKETDLHVYFSGSKGFHIIIDEKALSIKPRNDLHRAYKHIAGYLRYRLGDTSKVVDENGKEVEHTEPLKAIDLVVYTAKRMLRLPYSRHQKTGLYKIELSITELNTLTLDEIKERAKVGAVPTSSIDGEEPKSIRRRPKAGLFYDDKLQEYIDAAATASQRYDKEEYVFTKDKPPVCVQDILQGGWKKDGDRNQATVQLACYFKAAGHTKEETLKTLEEWVVKHTSAESNYSVRQRIANTRSVVEAVFSKENNYKFGCAFIRSLHGEKKRGSKDYERVPCSGELCHVIKRDATDEDAISLHLASTSNAELTGKLIKTRVMVAGKKHTPYIVPKKIEYSCWGRDKCKKYGCPLLNIPIATAYKDITANNRELIQMTATGDDNIKGILRDLSGIPACQKYDTTIVENTNIDELLVIPMADDEETEAVDSVGTYVLRKIYSMGNMPVDANKYYEITGYVYPHPRNQESTILVTKVEPLQDAVESFKLTDEVKEQLGIFKPTEYTQEAIAEKLGSVLNDLTYNVTGIVERDETLLGVLLVYHSVLRFNVPWDEAMRGWVELKIVGDTGTGKSALIEKLMKFTGLGNRVNAESTSRTGLTYKMEQSGSGGSWYIVWGAWPLADRAMIWIDEDTGITKDEYSEMTLARSDGRLEVKRAVTAETPCRVRAVLSGNVPKGKRLADYAQGVESLRDVFNNEDIRRFDFAIFMRATDVNPELYNQQLPTFPTSVTSEALKNNILFAWSRKQEHVTFAAGAVDEILEAATELSKIYGKANDVPLVSPSDQRNKVSRLAVSLAVLTNSTDESGERIIVYPGHVKFILTYLKGIYNAPGCGLNYYARLSVNEEELTPEKFDALTKQLRAVDTLKGAGKYSEFISLFAQQRYLRLGDVEAMLSIEKEETKAIVNLCVRLRMLTMTSGGYRKTARFNSYIAKCFEMGLFDNMDDDII